MRLSNTNNFSASFNVATPYQMVVIHSSKLIYPRELYPVSYTHLTLPTNSLV